MVRVVSICSTVITGFMAPCAIVLLGTSVGPLSQDATSFDGRNQAVVLGAGWLAMCAGAAGAALALTLVVIRAIWLRWLEPALPRILDLPSSAHKWGPPVSVVSAIVIALCLSQSVGFDLDAPERASVRGAFHDFQTEVDRSFWRTEHVMGGQTSDREINLDREVTASSVAYYERLRQRALNANRSEVLGLPPLERLYVLTARFYLTEEVLKKLDGMGFMNRTFAHMWLVHYPVDPNPTAGAKIARIEIDGETATILDDEPDLHVIAVLQRSEKGWKVDVPASMPAWNERFEKMLWEKNLAAGSVDHRFLRVVMGGTYVPGGTETDIQWTAAPQSILDGPRPPKGGKQPEPESAGSGPIMTEKQRKVAYELTKPISPYAMANSVSPEEYGKELFARGILSWDSDDLWEFIDDSESLLVAKLCWVLAYKQAREVGEQARVEVLRRAFREPRFRMNLAYDWTCAEPSVELAEEMIDFAAGYGKWWMDEKFVTAFGKCGNSRVREMLEEHVNLTDPNYPVWAAEAVASTDLERGYTLLMSLKLHKDSNTVIKANKALARIGFPQNEDEEK